MALAGVLALEPSVLLLDEAASMLDERSRRELSELIRSLAADEGYTVVAVSHDTEELLAADRLLAVAGGGIACDGRPGDLLVREEVLGLCGLQPTYALQLCRELRRRGIDIGLHAGEKEAAEALWAYNSIVSRTVTRTAT